MPRTRSTVRKANKNRQFLDNLSIRIGGEQFTQEDFEDDRDIRVEERIATINPMNIWSKLGLDLTDSIFAKIYESATKFHEYDDNGDLIPAPMELVRLAIPRRVYTQSHIEYVIETFDEILNTKDEVKGYKITQEPEFLRHFTAHFEQVK